MKAGEPKGSSSRKGKASKFEIAPILPYTYKGAGPIGVGLVVHALWRAYNFPSLDELLKDCGTPWVNRAVS
jgi:hypothetical protein